MSDMILSLTCDQAKQKKTRMIAGYFISVDGNSILFA